VTRNAYNGGHFAPKAVRQDGGAKPKSLALIAAIVALALGIVGGTIAYIVATTNPVNNVFTPGYVVPEINESFDGGLKSNVTIRNAGNTDAFIRAGIVVTMVDASGNVYPGAPVMGENGNYQMSLNLSDGGWFVGKDGFYYYSQQVAPGASTPVLILSCDMLSVPAGYTLKVDVLADAIQSTPETVVGGINGVWDYVTVSGTGSAAVLVKVS